MIDFFIVALRKESVDRNRLVIPSLLTFQTSLSARRAWIEIRDSDGAYIVDSVALRKESVDRNDNGNAVAVSDLESLSARRAWIEIRQKLAEAINPSCRSPQGERG